MFLKQYHLLVQLSLRNLIFHYQYALLIPMKLSQKQLRRLILEAIQGRRSGEPEPFLVSEMPGHRPKFPAASYPEVAELVVLINDSIERTAYEYFSKQFDSGDPSMQAAGDRKAWEAQATTAAAELVETLQDELESAIAHVQDRLINGGYYQGLEHRYTGGY